MGALLLLGLLFGVGIFFPRFAGAAARLTALGFIFPFFTLAGGSVLWGVGGLLGILPPSAHAWLGCCLLGGAPLAAAVTAFVLRDDRSAD